VEKRKKSKKKETGIKSKKLQFRREFAAGGIVFKKLKVKNKKLIILWLITRSSPSKQFPGVFWRLPKGWLDDSRGGKSPGPKSTGEIKVEEGDLIDAAKREVAEEGGIDAEIVRKIGTEKYFLRHGGKNILKFVTFYLMEWVRDLEEGFGFETTEVGWFSYIQARKTLSNSYEKKVLDKAKHILDLELK